MSFARIANSMGKTVKIVSAKSIPIKTVKKIDIRDTIKTIEMVKEDGPSWNLKKSFDSKKIVNDEMPFTAKTLYIRVSKIHSFCPREEVLRSKLNIIRKTSVPASGSLIFEYGHLLHKWAQDDLFAKYLLGAWKCKVCGKHYGDVSVVSYKPDVCSDCGSSGFNFVELHLYNDDLRLGGHPDGFVVVDDNLELLDFKSASMESFGGLETFGIHPAYIWQANGYMLLTNLKKLRLVFINKNGPTFKEKLVLRDETIIEEIINKCKETITGINSLGAKPFYLPARKACDSKTHKRAQSCPARDICFSFKEECGFID